MQQTMRKKSQTITYTDFYGRWLFWNIQAETLASFFQNTTAPVYQRIKV